jgi:hypothetical protein
MTSVSQWMEAAVGATTSVFISTHCPCPRQLEPQRCPLINPKTIVQTNRAPLCSAHRFVVWSEPHSRVIPIYEKSELSERSILTFDLISHNSLISRLQNVSEGGIRSLIWQARKSKTIAGSKAVRWLARFYPLFALAVTAAVQPVGVCLVFASLIIPVLAIRHLSGARALMTGYVLGTGGYALGLVLSAQSDLSSGKIVVWNLASPASGSSLSGTASPPEVTH